MVKQLKQRIKANETAVKYATDMITGNKGGHVVIRRYPDGKPFEILIMDTEDINTAADVLRINKSGIGFSQSGYNGPYATAMTIDGHIVADFMDTGTLRAIDIEAVNIIGSIITGTEFHSAGQTSSTDIYDGFILTNSIGMQGNGYQSMHNTGSSLYGYGNLSTLINYAGLFTNGEINCKNIDTDFVNSGAPITHLTIKDYKFPPEIHNHDNDYALKQHAHDYAAASHKHLDLEGAISNIHDILAQIWNTIHTYHP
jgi:phage-related protein